MSPDERRAAALAAYERREPTAAICERLYISRSTLLRWCAAAGLPTRRRPWRATSRPSPVPLAERIADLDVPGATIASIAAATGYKPGYVRQVRKAHRKRLRLMYLGEHKDVA